MGMEKYMGTWFEYERGQLHPDIVKLCEHARGRAPTDYEREELRKKVDEKLAFIHQTEVKVPADEANMKKIDTLLQELAEELKQKQEQEQEETK